MNETQEVCPVCSGTGWQVVEKGGLSGAVRCNCASTARVKEIRNSAGIPPNCAKASLENFQIPADNAIARSGLGTVLMQVKSYVREFPAVDRPGLLLVGDTGTGKTHLAVAALRVLIERGHEGVFFDYQNLLERIRSSYNRDAGAGDKEVYGSALDAEILLLDDLGSHRVTDWVEDTVTSIITHRCNYRKPLIATTNCPDPDITGAMVGYTDAQGVAVQKKTIAEVIGQRARSRLFEMCRVIRMPAVQDYRVSRAR